MSSVAGPAIQVVEIPLSQIRPNPDNPRHVITPEMVEALAASIKSVGLLNPIKLQRVKDSNQQPGIPTSPNAPIGAAPRDDHQYEVISGHIRLAAVKRLGWEAIPAYVLERTPKEAMVEAILDNRGQQMTWLDLYVAAETLLKLDPDLSQQEIGDMLEMNRTYVGRGIKLLPLLTPAAREAICKNLAFSDGYQVSENAIFRLTTLGDPQKVEEALPKVLEGKMTEGQVRALVATLNGTEVPQARVKTRLKPIPEVTPTSIGTPASTTEPKAATPSPDGLKELVMGGAAGALGGFLAANFKRALGTLVRRYMLHGLVGLGALALFLTHGFGSWVHKEQAPAVPAPVTSQPAPEAPQAKPYPPIGHKPMGTNGLSRSKAPSEGKAPKGDPGQGIPSWAPEGVPLVKDFADRFYNRSYQNWDGDQAYLKARLTEDYAPVFLKQNYPPKEKADLQAKQEVQIFSNAQVTVMRPLPNGPQAGGRGLGVPSQGADVNGGTSAGSAQYRVQGQVVTQSRAGKAIKNLGTKPVALEISVRHVEGMGYRVEKVTEVAPDLTHKAGAQTEESGDAIQKGAKDVGDAATTGSRLQAENHDLSVPNPKSTPQGDDLQGLVKAVGDSAEAAQKVKGLFGL